MMGKKHIDFQTSKLFSKKFNEFILNETKLNCYPTYDNINNFPSSKSFTSKNRELLHTEFKRQYLNTKLNSAVKDNIESILLDNSYTITTGHQLNIFTGPLYIIYKIISCIKLAENLNKRFPDKKFIPVYWMASEDHDFEEIQSFYSRGKNYVWETETSGSVGNIDPKSLEKLIDLLPGVNDFFREAYLKSETLSEAVRKYMNSIFKEYGLLILDPDSEALKKSFSKIIMDDILNNSINDIESKSEQKSSVHVRKINFFYKESKLRERIIKREDRYYVNNTEIEFSSVDLKDEIKKNPHKFSPNVIMRCFYQQVILPNAAYIGGPSEVVYWLGFNKFFKHYNLHFPVIVPRDFVLLLSEKSQKIMGRYNIENTDLFLGKAHLEKKALKVLEDRNKNFSDEISKIKNSFNKIADKFYSVDKSMKPHVLANSKKTEKILIQMENRFVKSLKSENKKLVSQVGDLYDEIFPEGSIQERKENIMSYYNSNFISNLFRELDPLELKFKIIKL